ncbi:glycoside hydrolase family protein [Paenibacillus silvisoli]|uniref:beta-L-arabinofuranosidase domain-containing protein n=1 Tax=Paenibacillus silvisoli TaxID=3110539 RepID=UPI002804E221|nr:beta-L-arabinofuranosidase domain-containing protein [Paenibacillus silvisoli]
MKSIQLERVTLEGDLRDRLTASASRLADSLYGPDEVFKPASYDWPGDNEGRTLLAQVLTARATGTEPLHTAAIMAKLPEALNARGYFGSILPEGMTDEQQLSGNSWYLRALAELYAWKKEPAVLSHIESVVKGLLLPATTHFAHYPTDPQERASDGQAAGTLEEKPVRNWYLSTDIGCAFIMLDGATHAYELLGWPELKETIEEMIRKFLTIDLIGISAQTHATLSALRGMLRYYGMSGEAGLLAAAERVFELYVREGMTENGANRNWFNRPWWTEPCAIVDSFIAAVELWRHTSKPHYLETAHLIYFNGIGHGQRSNGGFGCDNCAGSKEHELFAMDNIYEAYWCCTMRGGEGLARAAEYGFWLDGNRITVPFYHNGVATLALDAGEAVIRQTTAYPYEGRASFEVLSAPASCAATLRFYIPQHAVPGTAFIYVNGVRLDAAAVERDGMLEAHVELSPGMRVELQFELGLARVPAAHAPGFPDAVTMRHGALLLRSARNRQESEGPESEPAGPLTYRGEGVYADGSGDVVLSPIYIPIRLGSKETALERKAILFR